MQQLNAGMNKQTTLVSSKLQLHMGLVKGYNSYEGSITLKEALGANLAIFTLHRMGKKRSGTMKLQIPLPLIDAGKAGQAQMNVIDQQDKSGFELILSKKKRYLFKTSNAKERD